MNALILFFLLQAADFASTLSAFALGGGESNPIVARIVAVSPVVGLLLTKLLVTALGGMLVWRGSSRGMRLVNLAYCGVVLWNVSVITRLVLRA